MIYFLDTNAVSDLLRRPDGAVGRRAREAGFDDLTVSGIVAAELRFGVVKNDALRLGRRLETLLSRITVEPFDDAASRRYAEARAGLEAAGRPLDGNDMLIAAHALALGRPLVTDDRAFLGVPGLVVENWLRDEWA